METDKANPIWLVVMGVSGCGKSSLGQILAATLGLSLIEGDDFHPPVNIRKMNDGVALTDSDRAGWLELLSQELAEHAAGAVLTCSALKLAYRERLRTAVPNLRFVFMSIDRDTALARVQSRAGSHFFSSSLVDSQFDTLEPPLQEAGVLAVPAQAPLDALCVQVQTWLKHQG